MDSFTKINPALFDVVLPEHDGYPAELAAEDTRDALVSAAGETARDFPQGLWIEPSQWAEKARENDQHKTWAMNYLDRYTNQNPSHSCTCHSLRANFEAARNRQRGIIFPDGPKKSHRYAESAESGSVWISTLSVYAEANPREWGGANVRQVLEIMARRGALPDTMQPRSYSFKHSLQGTVGKGCNNESGGSWIPVSRFPNGWQETAKHFRPLEVVFPESYEQAVCLLLHGYAVSVGRSGHAVPWSQYLPGQGAAYADSYEVTRYDSERTMKSAWRGSFSIISTVTPDDWLKPAG